MMSLNSGPGVLPLLSSSASTSPAVVTPGSKVANLAIISGWVYLVKEILPRWEWAHRVMPIGRSAGSYHGSRVAVRTTTPSWEGVSAGRRLGLRHAGRIAWLQQGAHSGVL